MRRFIVSVVAFCVVTAHAASFDCAKASHPVEKAVCANADISSLDDTLAVRYKALTKSLAADSVALRLLKAEQKSWVALVRKNGAKANTDSIRVWYKNRVEDLGLKWQAVSKRQLVDGNYSVSTECARMVEGDSIATYPTTNVLAIKRLPSGNLTFNLATTGVNCRGCDLGGEAKKSGTNAWEYREPSSGTSPGCVLQIQLKGATVLATSENCEGYCGSGAELWGEFPLSTVGVNRDQQ